MTRRQHRALSVGAEIEPRNCTVRELERAQSTAEAYLRAALLQQAQRRIDQHLAEAIARDQRPARACPRESVSRTIAPASAAEPSVGSMLSAASSSGCTKRS